MYYSLCTSLLLLLFFKHRKTRHWISRLDVYPLSRSVHLNLFIQLFMWRSRQAGRQAASPKKPSPTRPPTPNVNDVECNGCIFWCKNCYICESMYMYSVQSTFVVAWPAKRKILNICTTEKDMKKGKTSEYVRYVAYIGFDRKAELWVVGERRERELKNSGRLCTEEQNQDRWDCNSDISFQTYRLSNPLCLFIKRNVRLFK